MNAPARPTAPELEARLREALAPIELRVIDESAAHAGHAGAAEGRHFRVEIRSAAFAGLSRLARHRLVYDALSSQIRRGIHALAIVAEAP
ncbi:MAG: BolA family transcriptional regulator [Burkholderiaceae bacterium]|nr:BolA family transcriptional regulator [Burkholderiaceae bacterium]